MSNIFSKVINQLPNLHLQAIRVNSQTFSGNWSLIELQPDVFSPQKFVIGVVVQPVNDRLYFKLLDEFKKFECIYGDSFPQRSIRELLSYAEFELRKSAQLKTPLAEIQFGTENLNLTLPQFTSGNDYELTVERLYDEIVVMAPHQIKKGREFISVDTNKVRNLVNEELKKIANLDYEKIVLPNTTGMLYEDNGTRHYLDFNLLTKNACGSVVSAVYKSPQTIEINLLKSSRDLTTYARIKKIEDVGVFLLLPNKDSLEPKEYTHIEGLIGEHSWKLERDGFHVVGLDTHMHLAKEVYEWALPTI